MDKKFWLILAGVVVLMIGLFALSGGKSDNGNSDFQGNAREIQPTDRVVGDPDSGVVLIEYADFQCPGCASVFPALQQVKQEFEGEFAFVFRHFPLTNIHPNAMAAHRAAEAAGKQGQFFEMHDILYARQQQWSTVSDAPSLFESYAEELQLNMDQYRTDVASQEVFDAISRDQDSGNQLGVNSTPTFLLNGEQISTPRTADELRQVLQDAINDAGQQESETENESES